MLGVFTSITPPNIYFYIHEISILHLCVSVLHRNRINRTNVCMYTQREAETDTDRERQRDLLKGIVSHGW